MAHSMATQPVASRVGNYNARRANSNPEDSFTTQGRRQQLQFESNRLSQQIFQQARDALHAASAGASPLVDDEEMLNALFGSGNMDGGIAAQQGIIMQHVRDFSYVWNDKAELRHVWHVAQEMIAITAHNTKDEFDDELPIMVKVAQSGFRLPLCDAVEYMQLPQKTTWEIWRAQCDVVLAARKFAEALALHVLAVLNKHTKHFCPAVPTQSHDLNLHKWITGILRCEVLPGRNGPRSPQSPYSQTAQHAKDMALALDNVREFSNKCAHALGTWEYAEETFIHNGAGHIDKSMYTKNDNRNGIIVIFHMARATGMKKYLEFLTHERDLRELEKRNHH